MRDCMYCAVLCCAKTQGNLKKLLLLLLTWCLS